MIGEGTERPINGVEGMKATAGVQRSEGVENSERRRFEGQQRMRLRMGVVTDGRGVR